MKGGFTSSAAVGVAATQVVAASYTRKRLVFHPPASGRITISDSPNPTLDGGPTLIAGTPALIFDTDKDEEITTSPFYAIGSAAGLTLGITEVHWDKPIAFGPNARPATQPVSLYPYAPFSQTMPHQGS